jgi:hypothetical protein
MNFLTFTRFAGSPIGRVTGGSQIWPVLVQLMPKTPVVRLNFSARATETVASQTAGSARSTAIEVLIARRVAGGTRRHNRETT